MASRQQMLTGVLLTFTFLGVIIFVSWTSAPQLSPIKTKGVTARDDLHGKADLYRRQRNQLSQILNTVKRDLAMMSCDVIDLKSQLKQETPSVSVAGGWCRHTSKSDSGNHAFDKSLAMALIPLLQDSTVASFGDGPGDYKKYLDATHKLKLYHAYDGAPYSFENSGGAVNFMDLTAPQYGLPVYDWVVSLEVAEHIPAKYENIYIDNIVRHARKGIVLSWAVPGQGGLSHVNEKPLTYVQRILSAKGFEPDTETSVMLQHRATLPWMKNNVYVYRRRHDSAVIQENA